MSTTIPPLSGHLGELVRRGHGGAAVRLIMEWGGTRHYIPATPTPDSPLVGVIGMAAAKSLAELCGGGYYDVPPRLVLAGESLKSQILREPGTALEIAVKLGTTQCYVRRVLGSAETRRRSRRHDIRQMDMFD